MRRLTGLVVTGLCVCGSAAAQSGNPLVVPGPNSAGYPNGRLADRTEEGFEPATISSRAAGRVFDEESASAGTGAYDRTGTMLRNRLAAIGRLRAAAVENGDAELLEQAERLEQQARLQLHTHAAANASARVSSGPTHRTAAYESDPSANAQVITPASGHPIGGFRHDSPATRAGDTSEFGLPASVNLGAGERDFGESSAGEARFYSRRRNSSELPRSNDEPADAWYDAQSNRLPQSPPVTADPRIEERGFGPSAGGGVHDRGLSSDTSGDSPFATRGRDRHPGAETRAGGSPFALPDSIERAAPSGARLDRAAPAENPFAPAAFDAQPKPAVAESGEAEFPAGRYGARSSDYGQRSGLVFETGTSSGAATPGRPFGEQTAGETRSSGRDPGLPAAGAEPRRGLVYGSQLESEFPGRRPGLPSSMDAMQYYGREHGQATTAEGRAAGRDFGLTTASGTRSRIPVETAPSSDDPFGEMPGTSIGGALDTRADSRRNAAAPMQHAEQPKPEKRKRGLFSWFRRRGASEK